MKVCYLNFDGAPTIEAATCSRIGGLNIILFNLLKSASSLPHLELSLLYREDGLDVPADLHESGIAIGKIAAGDPRMLARNQLIGYLDEFMAGVKRRFGCDMPDLVHTSGSESGYVMSRLRQLGLGVPWVHTSYATLGVRRVVIEKMGIPEALSDEIGRRESNCLRDCDHVIALSEVDKQETSSVFGIPAAKITVAEPGVDHEIFHPIDGSSRLPMVISAGRMSRVKDFPFLVRCFRQVVELNPKLADLMLVIVGGNEKERGDIGLPRLISDLGLEAKASLIDGVSQANLARMFRRAKVFAGVSQHETFGLIPVEARACGTPFVVRSNGSYIATAVDGFGGYFADNDSERDMADKISRILNLPDSDWANMSRQAIESSRMFRWPEMVAKCLHVYQQLL